MPGHSKCVCVCVCMLKLRKIQASASQESFGRSSRFVVLLKQYFFVIVDKIWVVWFFNLVEIGKKR